MDRKKRFPRPQNTNQWEPKSNIAQVNQQKKTDGQRAGCQEKDKDCTPKHEVAKISYGNTNVINTSNDNWTGKNDSIYIQPQTARGGCKEKQSSCEDIFPRKRRSDLNPQIWN